MDLGDWQELSRLRFENHLWHRCVDAILEALRQPGSSPEAVAGTVNASVETLNGQLVGLRRRPVTRQR